jgi:hypothetical protein
MKTITNNWAVRNRTLGIQQEDGVFFVPPAEEIYRQLIELENVETLTVSDGVITLSRMPLKVIGRLRRSFEEERIVARISLDGVAGDASSVRPHNHRSDVVSDRKRSSS